jgi:hypothetical protein
MEIVLIVAEKEYKRLGTTHYVRKDFTRDHWQQAAGTLLLPPWRGRADNRQQHPAALALARAHSLSEYCRAEEHDSAVLA